MRVQNESIRDVVLKSLYCEVDEIDSSFARAMALHKSFEPFQQSLQAVEDVEKAMKEYGYLENEHYEVSDFLLTLDFLEWQATVEEEEYDDVDDKILRMIVE